MRTLLKDANGIDWSDGVVMNGKWRRRKLKDVLDDAARNPRSGFVMLRRINETVQLC